MDATSEPQGRPMLSLVGKTHTDAMRADTVAVLEQALRDAKDGKILSVGLAIVTPERAIETEWSDGPCNLLVAAAAMLSHRICGEAVKD